MKNYLGAMLALNLISSSFAFANSNEILLSIDEIANSSLSETEKGFAIMAISIEPTIVCVSGNESAGASSERLNIYRLDIGSSVAIWRTPAEIKVFSNEADNSDLEANFKQQGSLQFEQIEESRTKGLELTFGRLIPMVGKLTSINFFNPASLTTLVCRLNP